MSCYSLAEVYEIVKSFDSSIPSIEDFCISSMKLNYEPKLSLVFKDSNTIFGFIMLGVNGNQAYVIKSDFGSNDAYECVSLLLNNMEEQFVNFSKLKLLKMIIPKESFLSKQLESHGFVCHRTLSSYELNPCNLDWKENSNIKLVKKNIAFTKMRKIRIKEVSSLLVSSYFDDDEVIFRDEYYSILEDPNEMGGVFCYRERNYKTVIHSSIYAKTRICF